VGAQERRLKFRRQHPVGHYIVDFYCTDRRLAVELDGGQHFTDSESRSVKPVIFRPSAAADVDDGYAWYEHLFDRQEPVSGREDLDTRRPVAHHFACERDDDPTRLWILENRALQRTELAGTGAGIVEIRANLD